VAGQDRLARAVFKAAVHHNRIIDQRPGRCLQLGQSSIDIAALVVSPEGGDRDVDR